MNPTSPAATVLDGRQEAGVDRRHDRPMGRLPGVPASTPTNARLVRAVHVL